MEEKLKRILAVLLILAAASGAVFADDLEFVFEEARFHSDYLFGFAPLYARAGLDYSGISLD